MPLEVAVHFVMPPRIRNRARIHGAPTGTPAEYGTQRAPARLIVRAGEQPGRESPFGATSRERPFSRAPDPSFKRAVASAADVRGICDVDTVDHEEGKPTFRVATWNLEWAQRADVRAQQAQVIAGAAVDVWVLTEARHSALPEGWESAASAGIPSATGNLRPASDAGCFAVVGAPTLRTALHSGARS